MVKIAQIAKTGLFPSQVTALGALGFNLASAAYWHKAFPYKSSLAGVSGQELADGYEKESGKQWTQQLGATLSLFDAGAAALSASSDPMDKAAVAKAMSTLKTVTIAALSISTPGPCPMSRPGRSSAPNGSRRRRARSFRSTIRRPSTPTTRTFRSWPSSSRLTADASGGIEACA